LLNEPRWLSVEAVVEINRAVIAITGEPHLLRDRGLLESALARARNFFGFGEEDIVVLAVSLITGIARAHAFAQGNKRTCFVAMVQFLKVNGYDLAIDDSRPWADRIIALVEHRTSEEDFVRAVRPFVVAIE
jgi:death-on-curing protein